MSITMRKKQFTEIAKALNASLALADECYESQETSIAVTEAIRRTANKLADFLQTQNPQFDREKFISLAMGEHYHE